MGSAVLSSPVIWHGFFEAIWHHRPINGSSVGGLVGSPSSRCQRSVPGDGADLRSAASRRPSVPWPSSGSNSSAPTLEEGVPLARVARDRGLALRTARRWAGQYRREGLAGLARKGRSDRGKRRLSDTLRQGIEGLALKKPPLSAASIHRQAVTLAERLGRVTAELQTPSMP